MSETRGEKGVWAQVSARVGRLSVMEDTSLRRATLARLRHGIGRLPGDVPELWDILFEDLPEAMLSRNGEPTREEWAIHTALTLYALHQQGKDPGSEPMNVRGISLGRAAALLAQELGEGAQPRVARRFNQIATASDMEQLSHYLRELITLLRSEGVGLDYPMLASDLYRYQNPYRAHEVRLSWGQDFYRRVNVKEELDREE